MHEFLEGADLCPGLSSRVHVGHSRNSKYNYSKALNVCNANAHVFLRIDRRPHDHGPTLKRLGLQSLADSRVTAPSGPT